ncbi:MULTISPECIES: RHS repeat-associated core domain-containing protein [unclassified Pseudomonas]|uniref:RHS repeat-associated core domain-containing protein n=1 Tax=unclassified Pseudomonas TaxID=196821 RepID=UPI00087187C6|nr:MULTISPECIES: RHS repeat-associated core domain-containing protein [unclassified Pseudomonas]SCW48695.1 RHS repeat-associated core domain-containing protein [Pseudomonas sp. NFACC05-1]SDW26109.1 RHS repeat-associated core domain-containing protein [Pseudomonas sp. NFACC08-1]SFL74822.1 RHS repeat-associated core domain-containing protein [Pseudomonas sp. NFACC46-3]
MPVEHANLLCRYRYDPLDRLVDCTPTAQAKSQRFYLKDRLATEIQGSAQCSIYQQDDQLLALQQRHNGALHITLLTTDLQRSVLHVLDATGLSPLAYTPYGHCVPENGLLSLLGFNGERPDPVTGHYLLGNGYRAFNPVLMRFNNPDSLSPFGEGGMNTYTYCSGDPLNRTDPTGRSSIYGLFKSIGRNLHLRKSTRMATPNIKEAKMSNFKIIDSRVVAFESSTPTQRQLIIEAHGTPHGPWSKTAVVSSERRLTPQNLHDAATRHGINFGDYDNVGLLICYAGKGGGGSFAGRFAKLTGKPVDAYRIRVGISQTGSPLKKLQQHAQFPGTANQSIFASLEGRSLSIDPEHAASAIRFTP